MSKDRDIIPIAFETERFLFRPLSEADVSERWAGWLNDPVAASMLNARPGTLSLGELRDYVRSFDGRQRWLIGIFERRSGRHIGIGTGEVHQEGNKFTPSVLVGEAEFRNIGMLTEILDSMGEYYFETLAFDAAVASVVAHNAIVIGFLQSRGFKLVRVLPGYKKSARGGPDIDLLVYEFSRADWRAYRDKKLAGQSSHRGADKIGHGMHHDG